VVRVETTLAPDALLDRMQRIERDFGRERGARNAARVLDLDIIDHDGRIVDAPGLTLPHPRLAARAFVLVPLRDVAPGWRHPVSGLSVDALIGRLPPGQAIEADPAPPQ
jgi:2-amino-4-hydroxy-6-hydroxymethyldihydropteridine diphosphokinase